MTSRLGIGRFVEHVDKDMNRLVIGLTDGWGNKSNCFVIIQGSKFVSCRKRLWPQVSRIYIVHYQSCLPHSILGNDGLHHITFDESDGVQLHSC